MAALEKLQSIMAQLRDPARGCPWDQAQDFASIAPYTIEEAYEVADAIERNDMADLREELGDLLFQVVFHAQMASEVGAFTLEDVIDGVCDKMERRHPHIYGTPAQIEAGARAGAWEAMKADERAAKAANKGNAAAQSIGILDGIANTLPALKRAQKLQDRAARVGFDWPNLAPVFDKLDEEIAELKEAIATPDNAKNIMDELGDLLFVCTNLSRKLNVDAQAALRSTNQKFERRFAWIEKRLRAQGKSPESASLEEMESYWGEAKGRE